MLRKILIVSLVLVLAVIFGCQKETAKPADLSKIEPGVQKQAEPNITNEDLSRQLDKIEMELKQDIAETEPNV
jgi:hypothetical protein